MGMYTQLVVVADIKKEYYEYVSKIFNYKLDDEWDILPLTSPEFKEFLKCERYKIIPFAECSYHLNPQFNETNGMMVIWCNLKNYGSEIDKFYPVLKQISDEIICYKYKYEEDDDWTDRLELEDKK